MGTQFDSSFSLTRIISNKDWFKFAAEQITQDEDGSYIFRNKFTDNTMFGSGAHPKTEALLGFLRKMPYSLLQSIGNLCGDSRIKGDDLASLAGKDGILSYKDILAHVGNQGYELNQDQGWKIKDNVARNLINSARWDYSNPNNPKIIIPEDANAAEKDIINFLNSNKVSPQTRENLSKMNNYEKAVFAEKFENYLQDKCNGNINNIKAGVVNSLDNVAGNQNINKLRQQAYMYQVIIQRQQAQLAQLMNMYQMRQGMYQSGINPYHMYSPYQMYNPYGINNPCMQQEPQSQESPWASFLKPFFGAFFGGLFGARFGRRY